MEEMLIKAKILGVELPEKSNFYGYCNMYGYRPLTNTFISLVGILNQPTAKEKLPEAISRLREIAKNNKDYKQHTELALVVNLLSWDYMEVPDICNILAEEYYNIYDDFYEVYKDNDEAKNYFWEKTD